MNIHTAQAILIPEIELLDSSDMTKAADLLNSGVMIKIACNNWQENFSYSPEVSCLVAHNKKELFLKFRVSEQHTMAKITSDNGMVFTDSCVEFFISPDESGYYNFEFNCIGKLLSGFRKSRPDVIHASEETLKSVKRFASLGADPFEECRLNDPWELTVAIPVSALFRHNFDTWCDMKATANFYKCGDKLSSRHYLSWQPIHTLKPDFHTPGYFAGIQFA